MTTSIMSTLLLAFLAISAEARTLSDWQNKISMITDYGRHSRSPPPPPKSSPSPHQLTTGYQKTLPSPPPPPNPSSSPDQLTETGAPCVAGSTPCKMVITMVTDYGKRPTPSAPPTPKPSPSEHQASVEQLLPKISSHYYYEASS
ncbi:extensin-like [Pistacia vera]|uniref:extensin-like n=1 Tax=Pistacia vera TaxID=55513 RepID=UPI001263C396|nr:extensin-like [Pistacia vera]